MPVTLDGCVCSSQRRRRGQFSTKRVLNSLNVMLATIELPQEVDPDIEGEGDY